MTNTKAKFMNRKVKWSLITLGIFIALALLGFVSLLFGGRFIVNEDNFVLPAATTIERADGEVIGELFEERRYPVSIDRKSTRLNSSHVAISYAVFCLKKKKYNKT